MSERTNRGKPTIETSGGDSTADDAHRRFKLDLILDYAGLSGQASSLTWACPRTETWLPHSEKRRSLWLRRGIGKTLANETLWELRIDLDDEPANARRRPNQPKAAFALGQKNILVLQGSRSIPEHNWTHVLADLGPSTELERIEKLEGLFLRVDREARLDSLPRLIERTGITSLSLLWYSLDPPPALPTCWPSSLRELRLLCPCTPGWNARGSDMPRGLRALRTTTLEDAGGLPPSLESLAVSAGEVPVDPLRESCPNLEHLDAHIATEDLAKVSDLSRLRALRVVGEVRLVPSSWQALSSLEHVTIDTSSDLSTPNLDGLEGLKTMELRSAAAWVAMHGGCAPIAKLPKLRVLSIRDFRKLSRLHELRHAAALETFEWVRDTSTGDDTGGTSRIDDSNLLAWGKAISVEAGVCAEQDRAPTHAQLERWNGAHDEWMDFASAQELEDLARALWHPRGHRTADTARKLVEGLLRRAAVDDDIGEPVLPHMDLGDADVRDRLPEIRERVRDKEHLATGLLACAARHLKNGREVEIAASIATELCSQADPDVRERLRVPLAEVLHAADDHEAAACLVGELWDGIDEAEPLLRRIMSTLRESADWHERTGGGPGKRAPAVDLRRVRIQLDGEPPDQPSPRRGAPPTTSTQWELQDWCGQRMLPLPEREGLELEIALTEETVKRLKKRDATATRHAFLRRCKDLWSATIVEAGVESAFVLGIEDAEGRWTAWRRADLEASESPPGSAWNEMSVTRSEHDPLSQPESIDLSGGDESIVDVWIDSFDPRPANELGEWFWSRLASRCESLDQLLRGREPLESVSYSDRYVRRPFVALLLYQILVGLHRFKVIDEDTKVCLRTQLVGNSGSTGSHGNNKRTDVRVDRKYKEIQANVLRELLAELEGSANNNDTDALVEWRDRNIQTKVLSALLGNLRNNSTDALVEWKHEDIQREVLRALLGKLGGTSVLDLPRKREEIPHYRQLELVWRRGGDQGVSIFLDQGVDFLHPDASKKMKFRHDWSIVDQVNWISKGHPVVRRRSDVERRNQRTLIFVQTP